MNRREAVRAAAGRLRGIDHLGSSAERDAELLLLWSAGISRAGLYGDPERMLRPEEEARFAGAIGRRLRMEPVQYITGVQEFFGLEFQVSPAVLIPRPETEGLVEAALARLPADRAVRVADVGTGSGAIAVALASRLPRAEVVAIDVSEVALEVARGNARRHGVEGRVEFVRSDLFGGMGVGAREFDAILSNPPYVAEGDRAGMHPEVREWEPAGALFAGVEGMEVYGRLVPEAGRWMAPGGMLGMEIGFGQRERVAGLLGGWDGVEFLPDLRGIARVVVARRR